MRTADRPETAWRGSAAQLLGRGLLVISPSPYGWCLTGAFMCGSLVLSQQPRTCAATSKKMAAPASRFGILETNGPQPTDLISRILTASPSQQICYPGYEWPPANRFGNQDTNGQPQPTVLVSRIPMFPSQQIWYPGYQRLAPSQQIWIFWVIQHVPVL